MTKSDPQPAAVGPTSGQNESWTGAFWRQVGGHDLGYEPSLQVG